jgi:hypothetical protein
MMRGALRIAALATALAGCADAAAPAAAQLEHADASGFRFRAPADRHVPLTDPQAEHARLRWLERRLADAGLCRHGYRIDRRTVDDSQDGIIKPVGYGDYGVVYEGHCDD